MSSDSSCSSSSEPYDKTKGEEFAYMTLANKYVLIDKIGAGTFSAVWLAIRIQDSNLYAVKIQHHDHYYDGEKEAKFLEKMTAKGGSKNNLPTLIEYFDVNNPKERKFVNICMVMNLCIGSVYHLLSQAGYDNGFDIEIANKIMSDVIRANTFLHNMKYIHTDIKPENILVEGLNPIFAEFKVYIDEQRQLNDMLAEAYTNLKLHKIPHKTVLYQTNKVEYKKQRRYLTRKYARNMIIKFKEICNKYSSVEDDTHLPNYYKKKFNMPNQYDLMKCKYILSDFGTIKSYSRDNTDVIQTRYYRAPEVIIGCEWDYRADIWSLGCLYFELLTGDVIFNPDKEDNSSYSEDVHHLYWIHQLINLDIAQYINGKRYNKYYDKTGLRYDGEIEKITYEDVINECKKYDEYDTKFIINFLKKVFTDAKRRATLEQLSEYLDKYNR
jgi:serine/threonine-protein kinase SRPK3